MTQGRGPSDAPLPPEATREQASAAPEATPAGESPLETYIRANAGRYSEAALRRAALAAGNDPRLVDAALARYGHDAGRTATRTATRATRIVYLVAFVVLSLGMFLNGVTNAGDSYGGTFLAIVVWGVVLALGYAAAHLWLASRRAGLLVLGLIVALAGFASLGMGGAGPILVLATGLAVMAAAFRFGGQVAPAMSTSLPVLLSVPLLIVLALGGMCIATGLPIPWTNGA